MKKSPGKNGNEIEVMCGIIISQAFSPKYPLPHPRHRHVLLSFLFYYCSGGNTRTVATPKRLKRALGFFFLVIIIIILGTSFLYFVQRQTTIMTWKGGKKGYWVLQGGGGGGVFNQHSPQLNGQRAQIKYCRPSCPLFPFSSRFI